MKRPINIIVACALAALAFNGLRSKLRAYEDAELIKIAIPRTPLMTRSSGDVTGDVASELNADEHAVVYTADNRAEVYFFAIKTSPNTDTMVTMIRDSKGVWHADLGPGASY